MVERHRDTSKLSDTGRKCPDNVPLYRNKALFHGEEKALNTPGNPKDELVSKLDNPWPYKGLDYILGYFVRGNDLSLVAITSKKQIQILRQFNLKHLDDRLLLLLAMRHVAVLIPFMFNHLDCEVQEMPDIRVIKHIHQNFTCLIELEESQVKKTWEGKSAGRIFEKVKRVCQIIEEQKIPNVVQRIPPIHPDNERSIFRMVFTPRGHHLVTPTTRQELVQALKDIVDFLEAFHKAGLIFVDLRWPNVVRNKFKEKWFVVDLDDTIILADGKIGDSKYLDTDSHAPELFQIGAKLDHRIDIWSIGNLLKTAKIKAELPGMFCDLQQQCLSVLPHNRPTLSQIRVFLETTKD